MVFTSKSSRNNDGACERNSEIRKQKRNCFYRNDKTIPSEIRGAEKRTFSNPRTAVSQQLICCDSAYGADDAPFHCRVHRGTRCREP